ncbi:MAG: S-adenosylmethionine-dependent methyltransferase [Chrysothrix sp. TS-e1954]|nr:MAG: S-adenosylmethionine-dependent methyltransferase [Chrysothrix sp. TS-e1954]
MLPTPNTSHVSYDNVYEPSEDSFLFLDTLTAESDYLLRRFKDGRNPLVLEVGSGSGVVIAFVAQHAQLLFGRSDILTLGADVNAYACTATQQTVERNAYSTSHGFLGCAQADLASTVRDHSVDVLIFNPPYVPSDTVPPVQPTAPASESKFEQDSNMLALATDGGDQGMEVTTRLLCQLPALLSKPNGVAYVLLCAQNKPEEVKARLHDWGPGWSIETVGRSGTQGGWERLQIVRFARI